MIEEDSVQELPEMVHLEGVPDRVERHVCEDRASNQALADTLQFFGNVAQAELVSSHSIAENPNDPPPTYEVYVVFQSEGEDSPRIEEPVRSLIDADRVKCCDVVEFDDEHLVLSLQAIEHRVEPVLAQRSALESIAEIDTNNDTESDPTGTD